LPPPHRLEIARLAAAPGYYLLYLDEDGEEQPGTWHESLERAMEQANYEFGLAPAEWERVAPE
jgi:hypothetical protein